MEGRHLGKDETNLTNGNGGESVASRIDAHPLLGQPPTAPLVRLTFDGEPVAGRDGEPIAAALLASGYRVLRTMPHSGEPRGGYCMVGRCSDCQVVVDGVPNIFACVTPVAAGLDVQMQRGLGGTGATVDEAGW